MRTLVFLMSQLMKILFAISVFSFAALAWATLAVARTIRSASKTARNAGARKTAVAGRTVTAIDVASRSKAPR